MPALSVIVDDELLLWFAVCAANLPLSVITEGVEPDVLKLRVPPLTFSAPFKSPDLTVTTAIPPKPPSSVVILIYVLPSATGVTLPRLSTVAISGLSTS